MTLNTNLIGRCVLLTLLVFPKENPACADAATDALRAEVASKGWIAYGARADNGTWDLFAMRPDGSARRSLANTSDFEEAAPRFSPDGSQLLYRRLAKGAKIDHDTWGFSGELVIAKSDGSEPRVVAAEGELPWAAWMPDGKQLSCLYRQGIRIVDAATGDTVREMPRNGIYQQLFPSPDGKWFCGTGNVKNAAWNVVRMNAETGEVNPVHIFQSCTPGWFSDSTRMIYSSRPDNQKALEGYGVTQLWMANADGTDRKLVYGEDGFHIYGGEVSPDGAYVLFTKSVADGGGSEKEGAPMYLIRLADTPAIGGESPELLGLHPTANNTPAVIALPPGWEPHWTYTEIAQP
jgi:Tol biopolymer transport system component